MCHIWFSIYNCFMFCKKKKKKFQGHIQISIFITYLLNIFKKIQPSKRVTVRARIWAGSHVPGGTHFQKRGHLPRLAGLVSSSDPHNNRARALCDLHSVNTKLLYHWVIVCELRRPLPSHVCTTVWGTRGLH